MSDPNVLCLLINVYGKIDIITARTILVYGFLMDKKLQTNEVNRLFQKFKVESSFNLNKNKILFRK